MKTRVTKNKINEDLKKSPPPPPSDPLLQNAEGSIEAQSLDQQPAEASPQDQAAPMAEGSGPESSKPENTNRFIHELGALTFYHLHGSKINFDSLPEAEQKGWQEMSAAVLVGLDKMNKMVAPKVEAFEVEGNRNKNISTITLIIENFVKSLKIIKCPKCGGNAEIRKLIFPSTELANRIWDRRIE